MIRARLVLHAWLALLVFDAARLAGFARIHAWLSRRTATKHLRAIAAIGDVVWAVEEACVWYVKRAACLQRSVVATYLLRRSGYPASLVIGYRPLPFESHAWVEIEGVIVNDRPEYQKHFRVLERL